MDDFVSILRSTLVLKGRTMGVWELYNSSGLHKNVIEALIKENELSDESYSIVAAVGVEGSGKTTFLNEVFGTTFPESKGVSDRFNGPSPSGGRGAPGGARASPPVGRGEQDAPEVRASKGGTVRLSRAEPLARSLILAQPPQELLVLDVDGLSTSTLGASSVLQVRRQGLSWAVHDGATAVELGVAMADVLVFNVRYHSLSRSTASGLRGLGSALETYLRLCASGMLHGMGPMPHPSRKRMLLVIVRDFEDEEVSRDEVAAAFQEDLNALWSRMTKPSRLGNSRFSEFYQTEYAFLPSALLRKIDFMRRVGELQRRFLDPTADGYFFQRDNRSGESIARYSCPVPLSELELHIENVFKALSQFRKDRSVGETDGGLEVEGSSELEASYRCDEICSFIFSQYLDSARSWKSRAEDGRIIENFGTEADGLLQNALEEYDRDAAAFRHTKTFIRKRNELRSSILNDLRTIYAKQLLKLREVAFDRFKLALTRIQVTNRVEKDVERQIRENEKYFIEQADLLKCRDAPRGGNASSNAGALPWRHEIERRALVDAMREVATERLQFARLQGAYVPTQRQPVQFSFHYLHPNPFGTDSRQDRLTSTDPIRYDPTVSRVATVLRAGSIRPQTDNVRAPRKSRQEAAKTKVQGTKESAVPARS